jgi:hypothetical protein
MHIIIFIGGRKRIWRGLKCRGMIGPS